MNAPLSLLLLASVALFAPFSVSTAQGAPPAGATAGSARPDRLAARQSDSRPNLLLVVLDDVGVDLVGAYGAAPIAPACTPTIDSLAASGVLFRNAWANPLCSPTRAQMLTGRHGFRTGVGVPVNGGEPFSSEGLQREETTLAEALLSAGYRTAAFGKWHLATDNADPADPLAQGFQRYIGSIHGTLNPERPGGVTSPCPSCPPGCQQGPFGYYKWVKSIDGTEICENGYATSVTVDDALQAVGNEPSEPWFLYVAFNAIHSPFHDPPLALCPGAFGCICNEPITTVQRQAKAALEVADTELARLLDGLHSASSRPIHLVLVGDNGTPDEVAEGPAGSCFASARSKGTLYEGGVRVPLIATGPRVVPGEVDSIVAAVDVFATFLELAGVPPGAAGARGVDSVSLVPYLRGFRGALRETVYAERFIPNGLPFSPTSHLRAVRDERWKLIRGTGRADQLYDLLDDPCELFDRFPPAPGSAAEQAWIELDARLAALGVG